MARCPHCGEPVAAGQENCYACGHKVRARGYRAEHRVNPLVFVGAAVVAVLVLGGLWLMRSNAAKKQAVLAAEEEALRVQDSIRRVSHEWQDALHAARNDPEAQSFVAELDDIESRFESVRLRVAARPSAQQERVISRVEAELARLRETVVVLASLPEEEKPALRDSIAAGERGLEALTKELDGAQ